MGAQPSSTKLPLKGALLISSSKTLCTLENVIVLPGITVAVAGRLTVSPGPSAAQSAPAPSRADELVSNRRLQANCAGLAAALRVIWMALVSGRSTAAVAELAADVQMPAMAHWAAVIVKLEQLSVKHFVVAAQTSEPAHPTSGLH